MGGTVRIGGLFFSREDELGQNVALQRSFSLGWEEAVGKKRRVGEATLGSKGQSFGERFFYFMSFQLNIDGWWSFSNSHIAVMTNPQGPAGRAELWRGTLQARPGVEDVTPP